MHRYDYVRHPRFGDGLVVVVEPAQHAKPQHAEVIFARGTAIRRSLTRRVKVASLRQITAEEALGLPPSSDDE